mmetsp:Transcript_29135/g.52115  ORF Transcript_29135/g.52115 Transcript_29135/m.52115 type:complete len:458 (+) Transcript_29135:1822-3195(+)
MMQAMRSVRFYGGTGAISFSLDSANRKDIEMALYQTQEHQGKLADYKVISSSFSSSSHYLFYNPIIWADRSSLAPSLYKLNIKDCPFPEEYRRNSEKSQVFTDSIVLSIFAGSVVTVFCSYIIFYRKLKMTSMRASILPGTQNLFILVSEFVEVFMIAFLAPDLGPINFMTGNWFGSFFSSLDFESKQVFGVLAVAYAITSLCSLISLVCCIRKFRPFPFDVQFIAVLCVRPLFIPLAYLFLSTFDCSEAQSGTDDYSLTDSFMDSDCYEPCWKGDHYFYAVCSFSFFLAFIAVSIPLSAGLSNSLDGLQFETNPLYLLVRLPFLTLLIALTKIRVSASYHALGYIVLLSGYTLGCSIIKVMVLPTMNLMHNVCLLIVVVLIVIHTLNNQVYASPYVFVPIAYALAILIAVPAWIHYKRLPSYIKSPEHKDESSLFNFAFRISKVSSTGGDFQEVLL